MAGKHGKGWFANVKGANLLSELKKKLAPSAPEAVPKGSSQPRDPRPSVEDELAAAFAHRRRGPPVRKMPRPQPKAGPSKEVIKIADPAKRREALAAARAAGPLTSEAKPRRPTAINDLGEAAFAKLARLRGTLGEFAATHQAGGGNMGDGDKDLIRRRIKLGAEASDTIIDVDDGYFLGYDFGTSTTKIVARYPYGGVDRAFAIEVPLSLASAGQPHLWPTTLWWNREKDRFSPYPVNGLVQLESFKSALTEGAGHRICCRSGMTMAEASAAFLAMHVAYALGAALEREPNFRLAGINVGVPVATLAHTPTVAMFERVMAAALYLVPFSPALRLADVRAAFQETVRSSIPFTLHTELSGAIAGYCAAPRYYVGGHMIIDCGSATLDMASFALDGTSLKPVGIYDARVELLGADACATYQNHDATTDECRRAARHQEYLVFAQTLLRQRNRFMMDEGRFPYQIILIGGGIHCEVHAPLFESMENAFHRAFHRPQLASTLQYDESCEAGRLILADGLARDPIELRDVAMPRDPPPPPPRGPEPITKDQV